MAKANHNLSKIRIIGGAWRGRKVSVANEQGLRPTGDRIRETLFNWLASELPGAHCLDLFAGTGALGLEALSRGVAKVQFVEQNPRVAQCLREQLQVLNSMHGEVHAGDALEWLQQSAQTSFNIVFIDPPFADDLWDAIIHCLSKGGWLAAEAYIYIETPRDTGVHYPDNWILHRSKNAGQLCYSLYKTNP